MQRLGQQRKANYITFPMSMSRLFLSKKTCTAIFVNHSPTYTYGETVTLRCATFGSSPPYNFTWVVPLGSTSLSRGDITLNEAGILSTLTFTAFKEDSGQYSCQIEGNSGAPATTTLTVGNVLFYTVGNVLFYTVGNVLFYTLFFSLEIAFFSTIHLCTYMKKLSLLDVLHSVVVHHITSLG